MTRGPALEPRKLCSRKLWQLLSDKPAIPLAPAEEDRVIRELLDRRHYLAELRKLGKLTQSH